MTAANRTAKARIIFCLLKNLSMRAETGHNCRDRATKELVTRPFSNAMVEKGNRPSAMAALFR
jgi:hypothetical protein